MAFCLMGSMVVSNSLFAAEFDSTGLFEGALKGGGTVSVNTSMHDYTDGKIEIVASFTKGEIDKGGAADQYIMEVDLTLDQYLAAIEGDKEIAEFNAGPDMVIYNDSPYRQNLVTVKNKSDGSRDMIIRTLIGDYGKQTREYNTVITIKDKQISAIAHEKTRRVILIGIFNTVFKASANDLKKISDGIDLREGYGRITDPADIRSASADTSYRNFERIILGK